MDDADICRTAHLLIEQHGNGAACVAIQRAHTLLGFGNAEIGSVWIEIFRAINNLEQQETAREQMTTPRVWDARSNTDAAGKESPGVFW